MSEIIFQPKGPATEHKEGSIVIQSPAGARSGIIPDGSGWGGSNYTINTYVTNLPTTGEINSSYSGRFDDPRYYSGDTPS
jgi:hypothetical protein